MLIFIDKIQQQSMKGNYSPYNRTYKFICLQNQLAHIKNKHSVKSLGCSNLSIHNSPDKFGPKSQQKKQIYQSTRPELNQLKIQERSGMGLRRSSYTFIEPYRVIHKNQSFDRRRKRQQFFQNQRLAKRLCNISCSVIPKEEAEKQFVEHLSHKKIARRYDEGGQLKELLKISNYNSMTASKVQRSIVSGYQLCNISSLRSSNLKKSKKKTVKAEGSSKSKIIRLY